jgi:hypothetical protein
MIKQLLIAVCTLASVGAWAQGVTRAQRADILNAARAVVANQVHQPVKFKVDQLNVDAGWAMLIGEVLDSQGRPLDWSRVEDCQYDLDRMLWVVLQHTQGQWVPKHVEICASEPPYWYLEEYGGFAWPCGVYAGLHAGAEQTLEAQCRAATSARTKKRKGSAP